MKPNIIRFNVSLPENLLDTLDERLTRKGYSSHLELVRDINLIKICRIEQCRVL